MDAYRINCAIFGPASCGFLGVVVGVGVKLFGVAPVLTPALIAIFAWWPTDVLFSGALIGSLCGAIGAVIAITADIWRETVMRDYALRRF